MQNALLNRVFLVSRGPKSWSGITVSKPCGTEGKAAPSVPSTVLSQTENTNMDTNGCDMVNSKDLIFLSWSSTDMAIRVGKLVDLDLLEG
jgi:hypothetical protein